MALLRKEIGYAGALRRPGGAASKFFPGARLRGPLSIVLYFMVFFYIFFRPDFMARLLLRIFNSCIYSGAIHEFGKDTQYWHYGAYRCRQNNDDRAHTVLFWEDI
jgi:hypothetical protein